MWPTQYTLDTTKNQLSFFLSFWCGRFFMVYVILCTVGLTITFCSRRWISSALSRQISTESTSAGWKINMPRWVQQQCSSYVNVVSWTGCWLCSYILQQVLPKSFGKSASPSITAENALVRCMYILAVQWPLQTNPMTQPRVRYNHTAVPHAFYTLHCCVRSSLTGDIKIKIACNSDYVQIKTLNFTFPWQAVIVYLYFFNFQEIAMLNAN